MVRKAHKKRQAEAGFFATAETAVKVQRIAAAVEHHPSLKNIVAVVEKLQNTDPRSVDQLKTLRQLAGHVSGSSSLLQTDGDAEILIQVADILFDFQFSGTSFPVHALINGIIDGFPAPCKEAIRESFNRHYDRLLEQACEDRDRDYPLDVTPLYAAEAEAADAESDHEENVGDDAKDAGDDEAETTTAGGARPIHPKDVHTGPYYYLRVLVTVNDCAEGRQRWVEGRRLAHVLRSVSARLNETTQAILAAPRNDVLSRMMATITGIDMVGTAMQIVVGSKPVLASAMQRTFSESADAAEEATAREVVAALATLTASAVRLIHLTSAGRDVTTTTGVLLIHVLGLAAPAVMRTEPANGVSAVQWEIIHDFLPSLAHGVPGRAEGFALDRLLGMAAAARADRLHVISQGVTSSGNTDVEAHFKSTPLLVNIAVLRGILVAVETRDLCTPFQLSCDETKRTGEPVTTILVDGLYTQIFQCLERAGSSRDKLYALDLLNTWLERVLACFEALEESRLAAAAATNAATSSSADAEEGMSLFFDEEEAAPAATTTTTPTAPVERVQAGAPYNQIHNARLNEILNFIWKNWHDPNAGVSGMVQAIFEKMIDIYFWRKRFVDERETENGGFMGELLRSVVKMGWTQRGKAASLSILLPRLGTDALFAVEPAFVSNALGAMTDAGCISPATRVLEVLLATRKSESLTRNGSLDAYLACWLEPLLRALASQDPILRYSISSGPITGFLKSDTGNLEVINKALDTSLEGSLANRLRLPPDTCAVARICLLKTARRLGMFKGADIFECEGASDFVAQVGAALCHVTDEVRLDAYALVCFSTWDIEAPTQTEVDLVVNNLAASLSSHSGKFRSALAGHLITMITRLRTVYTYASKYEEKEQTEAVRKRAMDFFTWILSTLTLQLHPDVAFPRQTTVLLLLKEVIIAVAKEYPSNMPAPVAAARELASDPQLSRLLLYSLRGQHDGNRELAYDVLCNLPTPLGGIGAPELEVLLNWSISRVASPRPRESDAGAITLALLAATHVIGRGWPVKVVVADAANPTSANVHVTITEESGDIPIAVKAERFVTYCQSLLELLDAHMACARQSITTAALHTPMHGVILTLRRVFQNLQWAHPAVVHAHAALTTLLHGFIARCQAVVEITMPLLSGIAGLEGAVEAEEEGDAGEEAGDEGGDDAGADAGDENDDPAAQPERAARVCSWLACREAVTVLGALALTAPLPGTPLPQGPVIAEADVRAMGATMIHILRTARHRGTVEKTARSLGMLCATCLKSAHSVMVSLPNAWLASMLEAVESGDERCITRRSAGLPYSFLAILKAEKGAHRPLLQHAIKVLLRVANGPGAEAGTDASIQPQVHALNVLRSVFREREFAVDLFPYLADGFIAVINGFSSKSWAVRNSSTLTFASLVEKGIGNKRSSDQHAVVNGLTAREFFGRFPQLHPFLLAVVESGVPRKDKKTPPHTGLYSVLVLLSHLLPSGMAATTEYTSMESFIEPVRGCAYVPTAHGRHMAAMALIPLITRQNLCPFLLSLIESLPAGPGSARDTNRIHGTLLQILFLVRQHNGELAVRVELEAQTYVPLMTRLWLASPSNTCGATRAVATLIFSETVVHSISNARTEDRQAVLKVFLEAIKSTATFGVADVGAADVASHAAKTLAQAMMAVVPKAIPVYLHHPAYEVRLAVLNLLTTRDENRTGAAAYPHLAAARIIKEALFDRLRTETHDGCIAGLLRALQMVVDDDLEDMEVVWPRVVVLADSPYSLVREAALELLGCLLVTTLRREPRSGNWSDDLASYEVLLEKHSREGAEYSTRMACVNSLDVLGVELVALLGPVIANNAHTSVPVHLPTAEDLPADRDDSGAAVADASAYQLWRVVLRLLQDDDGDTRAGMAKVVSALLAPRVGSRDVILEVCEDRAIELVIAYLVAARGHDARLHAMLLKMATAPKLSDVDALINAVNRRFVLFTEEKTNIYQDSLIGVQAACQALAFLSSQGLVDAAELHTTALTRLEAVRKRIHLPAERVARLGWVGGTSSHSIFFPVVFSAVALAVAAAKHATPDRRAELLAAIEGLEPAQLHPHLQLCLAELRGVSTTGAFVAFGRRPHFMLTAV